MQITKNEPKRKVVIFTHYSPTVHSEANDPRHLQDAASVRSAFMIDLSEEPCWTSPSVKLWAFGHTDFNCDFVESVIGKRVVANQKGHRRSEADSFDAEKVVTLMIDQKNPEPRGDVQQTSIEHSGAQPGTQSKAGLSKAGRLNKYFRLGDRS